MPFPKNFLWGAASAAAQIEGGWLEDGRTPSVWDNMPAWKINKNETCHVACDHYHHWREDVELMKRIGLKAYRFSISWSRVIPAKGIVNPLGLQFYNDLVDALCKAGIQPMITLFHSDMPQWVFDEGGWENPDVVQWFADFAGVMVESLSDRVSYWFTMNEPQCFMPDYLELAGKSQDVDAQNTVYRNILLSHGAAVQAMRKAAKQPLKIGHVIMGMVVEAIPGVIDENMAAAMTFSDMGGFMTMVRWTDPMILGNTTDAMKDVLSEADLKQICQKLDFFAMNVYGSANFYDHPGRENRLSYPGAPKSHIGMPFRPKVLYYAAKFAYQRYQLPVLFSENGYSNLDFVMIDGKVHDPQRIDYIHRYLLELEKAIDEGIPVEAYLAAACNAPVTCMTTAGEGGPYGMALLAAYAANQEGTLEEFLNERVFADCVSTTLEPDPADVAGFQTYLARFVSGLPAQKAAVENL